MQVGDECSDKWLEGRDAGTADTHIDFNARPDSYLEIIIYVYTTMG